MRYDRVNHGGYAFFDFVGHVAYSVEGDTMRWAMHKSDRLSKLPRSFTTGKDPDVVVLTFRREKA